MTKILDGKTTSLQVERELTEAVQLRLAQGLKRPHLAAVLVGDNPASRAYAVSYTHLTLPTNREV